MRNGNWLKNQGYCPEYTIQIYFQATANLKAINQVEGIPKPWRLTYCYGRALQASALKAWNGDDANAKQVHEAFGKMALANSKASMGES